MAVDYWLAKCSAETMFLKESVYPLCLQVEDSHFNGQSAICSLLFKNEASHDQDEKTHASETI